MCVCICLFLIALPVDLEAQCAMCKASAESSLEEGVDTVRNINKGILYMLLFPFIFATSIGYFWWKANRGLNSEE